MNTIEKTMVTENSMIEAPWFLLGIILIIIIAIILAVMISKRKKK